ncbi:type III secretion system translocon subunit SctE [Breoghania sp. JC706]|uniref:type III secretion system translocon subunit SctE n=1 Tax=Breoghania sp. JC706 TaxID=3117732 RepID=UPI00300A2AFB
MSDVNVIRSMDPALAGLGQGAEQAQGQQEADALRAGLAGFAATALPEAGGNGAKGAAGSASRSYGAVMGALSRLMSKGGGDALDAELAMAIAKMKDVVGDVQTGKLLNDEEKKRASLGEKQKKIEEAQAKFDEAQDAKKDAGIWGWIKTAFSAIAAAISIAIGAALVATGVGVAVGALMIAGGVVGLIMTVDSIVSATTGKGMLGNAAYAIAMSQGKTAEEAAKIASDWDTGFSIAMAVVAVALAVATIGVGFSSLASAAEGVAEATQVTMKAVQIAGEAAAGIATVGEATSSIGQAVTNKQAADLGAEAKANQADGKRIEAFIQTLDDFIDILMAQISGANSRFNAMLETVQGSMNDRANTMARAHFTG